MSFSQCTAAVPLCCCCVYYACACCCCNFLNTLIHFLALVALVALDILVALVALDICCCWYCCCCSCKLGIHSRGSGHIVDAPSRRFALEYSLNMFVPGDMSGLDSSFGRLENSFGRFDSCHSSGLNRFVGIVVVAVVVVVVVVVVDTPLSSFGSFGCIQLPWCRIGSLSFCKEACLPKGKTPPSSFGD